MWSSFSNKFDECATIKHFSLEIGFPSQQPNKKVFFLTEQLICLQSFLLDIDNKKEKGVDAVYGVSSSFKQSNTRHWNHYSVTRSFQSGREI